MAKIPMARTEYYDVEIELPFYYIHHMDNSCIWGRIEDDRCVSVQETIYNREVTWELEIDAKPAEHFACYMDGRHNSSKESFDKAVARMRAHIEEMQLG